MSLQIVVGGQYGSEAKGAVTAAICNAEIQKGQHVTVVRVGGPNAGHSAYDKEGRLWALRQVPVGMVVDDNVMGVIADGSEIDPTVLASEIEALEAAGHEIASRLTVSAEATVITEQHKIHEAEMVQRLGSTAKGIGAARADRIMRKAPRVADSHGEDWGAAPRVSVVDGPDLTEILNRRAHSPFDTVVIEGTQGYGLGLHAGHYPQCTSSDCRAIDFMSMAGIGPMLALVHVVVRPYPIRVAGNSGPLKGETSWAGLGLREELTTVTRKVRRVGAWDPDLVKAAVAANGPNVQLAVSMVDQVPGLTGQDSVGRTSLTAKGKRWLHDLENETGRLVGWYGVGPRLDDWQVL